MEADSESEVTVEPLLLNGRGHRIKHEKGRNQAMKGDEARLWVMYDFTDQVKEYMRKRWKK